MIKIVHITYAIRYTFGYSSIMHTHTTASIVTRPKQNSILRPNTPTTRRNVNRSEVMSIVVAVVVVAVTVRLISAGEGKRQIENADASPTNRIHITECYL